jgi:hypothetical protein
VPIRSITANSRSRSNGAEAAGCQRLGVAEGVAEGVAVITDTARSEATPVETFGCMLFVGPTSQNMLIYVNSLHRILSKSACCLSATSLRFDFGEPFDLTQSLNRPIEPLCNRQGGSDESQGHHD